MDIRTVCVFAIIWLTRTSASVVNTTVGQVQGVEQADLGVEMFLGIPYAEAPEGPLRFKPPVRKSPMESVYVASSNDRICPQLPFSPSNITEDCLRLDIYKPITASLQSQLPVMVWIYGGGYYFGDTRSYSGIELAQLGVVVVAVNYRLGILGFLNTMDDNSVGNFGLRDQCSAIEWVTDNIAAFGGNASLVTIFGESAGATSVLQLALSSLCRGKFQRVIAQSGTPLAYWSYSNDPKEKVDKLAERSSCPKESAPLVDCLREKSIDEIISYQPFALFEEIEFGPTYTTDVFPENPLDIMNKGDNSDVLQHFRSIDVLLGVMAEEVEFEFLVTRSSLPFEPITNRTDVVLGDEEFHSLLRHGLKLYTNRKSEDLEKLFPAVKFQYTDWKNRDDIFANTRMYIRALGDISYMVGAVAMSRLHAATMSSGKTYFYKFNRKPSWSVTYPWTEGGTHTEDIPFVFGQTSYFNGTAAEQDLSRSVMEYWTNFAKTGDPNSPSQNYSNTTWPQFNTETQDYIEFDINMSRDSVSKYPYDRRFAFWNDFFPTQLKFVDDYNREKEKEGEICTTPPYASGGSIISGGAFFCTIFILLPLCKYF